MEQMNILSILSVRKGIFVTFDLVNIFLTKGFTFHDFLLAFLYIKPLKEMGFTPNKENVFRVKSNCQGK